MSNIPGFLKMSIFEYISWQLLLKWMTLYFHWFQCKFHNYFYFCKEFYHNWLVQNSSYNPSTRIPGCDAFWENTFLLLLIFSLKALQLITNAEFAFWFSHSWILVKLLTQNKLNYCTFGFWNSYFFCIAEVWHIPQCTAEHKGFSFTDISEVFSKLSYFLTYLTAIGFVLKTQQKKLSMDFCSQLKSIG